VTAGTAASAIVIFESQTGSAETAQSGSGSGDIQLPEDGANHRIKAPAVLNAVKTDNTIIVGRNQTMAMEKCLGWQSRSMI
jgi:hypothetical protein